MDSNPVRSHCHPSSYLETFGQFKMYLIFWGWPSSPKRLAVNWRWLKCGLSDCGDSESTTSQSNLSGRNKSGFYGALLHVVSAINNENHQQGFVSGYDKPFNYYFLFVLNESGNDLFYYVPVNGAMFKNKIISRKIFPKANKRTDKRRQDKISPCMDL